MSIKKAALVLTGLVVLVALIWPPDTAGLVAAGPGSAASRPASRPATTSAPSSRPASNPAAAIEAGKWQTSAAEAIKQARASNRLILADFTGSDWCVWCKKLKAEVFDTQEFKDWAAKNVILLELDYPSSKPQDAGTKKQNAELAKTYKIEGYPTILFLKADGTVAGKTGYIEGGPKVWLPNADKIIGRAAK
jgi:protein disulfide-isomerase